MTGLTRSEDYPAAGAYARGLSGGRLLIARGELIDVVRVHDMRRVDRVRSPGERVVQLGATRSGKRVFFGSQSGGVWRWDVGAGGDPVQIARLEGPVTNIEARDDGRLLFATAPVSARHGHNYLVDVEARRAVELAVPDTGRVQSGAFSLDGTRLAMSASSPLGLTLRSVRLDRATACAAAGADIESALWKQAIGKLPVDPPRCPRVDPGMRRRTSVTSRSVVYRHENGQLSRRERPS